MEWITETSPETHGYYIAAWDDQGHWRVSELWYNPSSPGSGWWAFRGYMARFIGHTPSESTGRSLTVAGWMPMPEYPGVGRIIAYKTGGHIWDPADVTIIREEL